MTHAAAFEPERDLTELMLGNEARIDDRACLLHEAAPVALQGAEPEGGIGVKQPRHHVPPPPVDGVGIGGDHVTDRLAVFECAHHASSSTITLPRFLPDSIRS